MARGKSAEKAAILERQIKALELRKAGYSFRAIGKRLGVTHVQAYRDVNNELKELGSRIQHDADELRQLELERLDTIHRALRREVLDGNPAAANATLKTMERRAKLLGLDKPTEIKVDIALFLQLQQAANDAGVDLSEVFEALIKRFVDAHTNAG